MPLDPSLQTYFDKQVEAVVATLPADVRELLDEVPIYVEDRASKKILRSVGLSHPDELFGLYTYAPVMIHLFRTSLLNACCDDDGEIDEAELREQIRITILHEIGHHHGMDEDEVDELGLG